MEDSANIYKLKNHPQLSAPFKFITGELNNTNHPYEVAGVNVNDLKPTQPFIDTDIVDGFVDTLNNGEELKPIWVSQNNDIIDGHHRFAAHMIARPDGAVPAIRLLCNTKQAIDLLNGIEETFKAHKIKHDQSEVLKSLAEEDDSMYIPDKPHKTNKNSVRAYRKNPLKKSLSGNFFLLKSVLGYKPYDIDFKSLLQTDTIDKKIANSQKPTIELAKHWFPTLNFKEKAAEFKMSEDDFINTIVAEKARIKGIDGIMYGDKLLQSIDDK
jgi:hypothetical protein